MYSAGGQQNLGGGGGEDGSAENSETEENMDTEEGVVEVSAWVLTKIQQTEIAVTNI